jgi:hypothetical protein
VSGFTKGPWYITDSNYLRIREEASDAVIATLDDGGHPEIEIFNAAAQEANAHLIAAAPDLYEAAEAACRWLGKGVADGVFADCANSGVANADLAKLEAALAKARGES